MMHVNCVVVGDDNDARQRMILTYTTNAVPGEDLPITFDTYSAIIMVGERCIELRIWDTAAPEDYRNCG
jgi:hypothetical protein